MRITFGATPEDRFVSFGKRKGHYSLNISKYVLKKLNCRYMNDNGCIYIACIDINIVFFRRMRIFYFDARIFVTVIVS